MSQIKAKSVKGGKKAYVWMLLDVAGQMHAVCYEASSFTELVSNQFMARASVQATNAFRRLAGPGSVSKLVDLEGKPIQVPTIK